MKSTLPRLSIILYFLLLSAIILLFASPTSPLFAISRDGDLNWFYMAGRAWAEGLLPYTDFTDSKGPFFLLVYALAYLISPESHMGVWLLEIPIICASYLGIYLITGLFIQERRWRLIATTLWSLFLFSPAYYAITRPEEFCLSTLIFSLYVLLHSLRGDTTPKQALWHSLILGAGIGACFLCKFNLALNAAIPLAALAYSQFKNQGILSSILRVSLTSALGAGMIIAPFIIYFQAHGITQNFFNEYIFSTIATMGETNILTKESSALSPIFTAAWKVLLTLPRQCSGILLICSIATIAWGYKEKGSRLYRSAPFILLLLYTISIFPSIQKWTYYTSIISPFGIFAIIMLLRPYLVIKLNGWKTAFICTVATALCITMVDSTSKSTFFFRNTSSTNFFASEYIIRQKEQPRIINLGHDHGYGITARSLPATLNWSKQVGESQEKELLRLEAISQGKANFICGHVGSGKYYNGDYSQFKPQISDELAQALNQGGYREVYRNLDTREVIYGKEAYAIPPESFSLRMRDTLLKSDFDSFGGRVPTSCPQP